MKDQLVSFETAKLAKEIGFDEKCLYHYRTGKSIGTKAGELFNETFISNACSNSDWKEGACTAPTQSLLQRWLREEHKIVITISHWIEQPVNGKIYSDCYDYNFHQLYHETIIYKTYEEALEEGLQEGLKLIKDEKS